MFSRAPLQPPNAATYSIVLGSAATPLVAARVLWFVPRRFYCICWERYDLVVAGLRDEGFIQVSTGTRGKGAFKRRGSVARLVLL